jgi:cyclophilin family peptidyl-prolyl cis-trans isomerase
MTKTLYRFAAAMLLGLSAFPALADNPKVLLETSLGNITLELNAEKAPASTENFLAYVHDGFYQDTVFHRVIKNFMIQGGGFTADLERKETRAPIQNEADNGLKNVRGTLAMARTGQPHSATSQFFINLKDNHFLDYREKNRAGWGYTVFGKVVEGMEVVDKIAALSTTARPNGMRDVPIELPLIQRMSRIIPAATPDQGAEQQ